ncbi:DNA-binding transcriptional regulator CytR [Corynebacterium capitovis DSM 44611]|nr:DNA-binding transcriptional regulator CytR [Corynebacterium capitovis DSM 44611]
MVRVPILRICTPEPDRLVHAVSYDAAAAGEELARRVLESGHTRIAVVRTNSEISIPEWTRATAAIGAIRGSGLEPFIVDVRNDTGADYILPLVQSGAVSVVMCPSDRRQVGFIELFERSGLSVPGDVSVTGCDGLLPGSEVMGLTTYRWPVQRVAETAMAQMIDIIDRFGTPDNRLSPVSITIGGELIPGRTLARVAGE